MKTKPKIYEALKRIKRRGRISCGVQWCLTSSNAFGILCSHHWTISDGELRRALVNKIKNNEEDTEEFGELKKRIIVDAKIRDIASTSSLKNE